MQPAAASKPLTIVLFAVEGEVKPGSLIGCVSPDGSVKQGAAVQSAIETTIEEVSECVNADDLVQRLLLPGCYALANYLKEERPPTPSRERNFTLHIDRDYSTGSMIYRVSGMPDGKTAKIANFRAPNRNDNWRIMRIEGGQETEWTGHYESLEEALGAL